MFDAKAPDDTRPRRRILPWLLAAGAVALGLVVLRAFLWERASFEVTRHQLSARVATPLRIAHLSDLHFRELGPWAFGVADQVQRERADIIVVTGDLAADGVPLDTLRSFFKSMKAPLGTWIVRGHGDPLDEIEKLCTAVAAHCLINEGTLLRPDVWIGGVDDPVAGKPDAALALTGAPVQSFKLVLFHAPDYFADVAGLFDLALAGHTHGGQVRLPGIGRLWLPPGGRRYPAGWFHENRSSLFVSRGIGTTGTPARLFCRPEIAIIEIQPLR